MREDDNKRNVRGVVKKVVVLGGQGSFGTTIALN